jgi:hypothetical protein
MGIREEVFYEGGPHIGDLIINILIGFTLVGLPLAFGAIIRAIWLRFRITSRRISVTGGWRGNDRTEIIYKEVAAIVTVPRGLGLWGDMVLTLTDGSRLEMRSLPNFRELEAYIQERIPTKAQAATRSVKA